MAVGKNITWKQWKGKVLSSSLKYQVCWKEYQGEENSREENKDFNIGGWIRILSFRELNTPLVFQLANAMGDGVLEKTPMGIFLEESYYLQSSPDQLAPFQRIRLTLIRIRFREYRNRIRPKIEINTNFFTLYFISKM